MDLKKLFAKSIGKTFFIKYYRYFEDNTYPEDFIINKIIDDKYEQHGIKKKYKTIRKRVLAAKSIFKGDHKADKRIEALESCVNSKWLRRNNKEIVEIAKRLLDKS